MRGMNRAGQAGGIRRQERAGVGSGMKGMAAGAGPEGFCECVKCGINVPHQRGVPCTDMKCPQCGLFMTRKLLV